MLRHMRRLLPWLLLDLSLVLAQKSGGGVGGRPYAPSPPPMAPGPAPSIPAPVPPYPGPVVVYPGGGGSLGILPVLVFLGLAVATVWMVRGLRQAEAGPEASAARLRLALLLSLEAQQGLRRLAEEADTASAKGLADLVDEAALLLLREEPAWRFARYEAQPGSEEEALAQFEAWMLEDRSKYRVEPGGRYLVVSLVLAERRLLPPRAPLTRAGVREALLDLAGSTAYTLLAAHLSWTPERAGEALTEEELLWLYPGLEKL